MAKKDRINLTQADIDRRVDFLLAEARSDTPRYDQSVRFTMRVISNFYTVGCDAPSSYIRLNNKRMSKKALDYKNELVEKKLSPAEIDRLLGENFRNEHPYELRRIWQDILSHKDTFQRPDVIAIFKRYPMITIKKEEDLQLNQHRGKDADDRYVEIMVMTVVGGIWRETTVHVD